MQELSNMTTEELRQLAMNINFILKQSAVIKIEDMLLNVITKKDCKESSII